MMDKPHLVRAIEREIYHTAGRYYRIELELLDVQSLRELHRLLQDLDDEKRSAANRARLMPWRTP
jgi:hypothetical protein